LVIWLKNSIKLIRKKCENACGEYLAQFNNILNYSVNINYEKRKQKLNSAK